MRDHFIEKMSDDKNKSSDDESLRDIEDFEAQIRQLVQAAELEEENGSDDRLTQINVHHLSDWACFFQPVKLW